MTTCLAEPDLRLTPAFSYGACFRYSPCGTSDAARRSRRYCALLKAQDPAFLAYCARCVHRDVLGEGVLSGLFATQPTLVPVPSSSRSVAGIPTAAAALADALVRQGLGRAVWPGLARGHGIGRSSRAAPGCRTSAQDQYRSLSVQSPNPVPDDILLVDDLVSRGRTLVAAAARLREAFPAARISAFAQMRTVSLVPDIESVMDPCAGEIRWVRGDARRVP
jgi:hypothetical protein